MALGMTYRDEKCSFCGANWFCSSQQDKDGNLEKLQCGNCGKWFDVKAAPDKPLKCWL